METVKDSEQQWQDLAIESFLNIVKAPDGNFDAIARLTKTLSDTKSLNLMVEFLSRHPQGRQAFLEHPRLGNVDLQQLHQFPQNTLGYIYSDSMLKNGLTPLQASSVNSDYEYLFAHITETHDLWHIVTGCDTNILGEIQLEAFYVAQLYASRFWLALLAKNLLKAVIYDVEVASQYMDAITQGWLMAKQAKPLFGIRWNTLWEKPLEDVRTSLNIIC
jgi:ubiquinone biosynthesis protein COQ4